MVLVRPQAAAQALGSLLGAALGLAGRSLKLGLTLGAASLSLIPLRSSLPPKLWNLLEISSALRVVLPQLKKLLGLSKARLPLPGQRPRGFIFAAADALPGSVLTLAALSWIRYLVDPPEPPPGQEEEERELRPRLTIADPDFPGDTGPSAQGVPSQDKAPSRPRLTRPAHETWKIHLEEDEVQQVELVRLALGQSLKLNNIGSKPSGAAAPQAVVVPAEYRFSDEEVARFLRVCKHDANRCAKRLEATAEWRRTFRPLGPAEVLMDFGDIMFWHATHPKAKAGMGRTCFVLRFGVLAATLPPSQHDHFAHALVSLMDCGFKTLVGPPDGRIAVVVDCTGCSGNVLTLPLGVLQGLARTLNAHFPDRLAILQALHTPLFVRLFGSLLLQVVPERTRQKVKFVGSEHAASEALADVFGSSDSLVPAALGGKCMCAFCSGAVAPAPQQQQQQQLLRRQATTKRSNDYTTREVYVPGFGVQRIRMLTPLQKDPGAAQETKPQAGKTLSRSEGSRHQKHQRQHSGQLKEARKVGSGRKELEAPPRSSVALVRLLIVAVLCVVGLLLWRLLHFRLGEVSVKSSLEL